MAKAKKGPAKKKAKKDKKAKQPMGKMNAY